MENNNVEQIEILYQISFVDKKQKVHNVSKVDIGIVEKNKHFGLHLVVFGIELKI